MPVPDSGVPAAIGYAQQSGLPFELGIIRNHYVGRTFIEPADTIRHLGVRLKHNANRALIEGKRVILVDDSIVRGTTSMKIVADGARGRRHARCTCASPPADHQSLLLRHRHARAATSCSPPHYDVAGMAKFIEVDLPRPSCRSTASIAPWASPAATPAQPAFCDACFTGDYPIPLDDQLGVEDRQLSLLVESA